ncbi:MAG: thioredoxin family protein [Alphaproteobacteria bacterium]|jgi:thiol-disulfide isomerase/thioredoxin|nr:thioredoxin family protein [Alphaproteobacteria bacterium]MBT5389443.1 thioredoxin family protein [Alphaproteobacteria bacterium]MBT5541170.1 thioredoxin family protein [Alphaproteobacteria bacterium]MBT5654997.1 thioredoxin family protein [Alphaproteobacteria bacterium]
MSLTPSNMLPLGTVAPDFELLDVLSSQRKSIQDLKSEKGTVVMFICNHCPFVKHVQEALVKVAKDYTDKGIAFIAINSNDVEAFPADSPDKMKELGEHLGFPFPYLYDESQKVAKSYKAACTPDFYVFDQDLKCVYRGQLDDSRPGNHIPVTGNDLRSAMDNLLSGKEVSTNQKPSIGCNIKWKQ